ncbi:unnamed protein product, partial [Urochloa humidicola]
WTSLPSLLGARRILLRLCSVVVDPSSSQGGGAQRRERGSPKGGRMRLSFPLVAGAVVIGVISGNVIFGPPLQKYWAEKQQQEAAKDGQSSGPIQ